MSPERLIRMANQIGKFFQHRPEAQAVADTADHLRKYWDPRMRRDIVAHFDRGGAGLDPIARKAVAEIAADLKDHHLHPAAIEGEE
jgi:formate dehydrogenase subunit delta